MNNNIKFLIISVIYLVIDVIWISLNIKMYNDNTVRIQGKLSAISLKIILTIILSYILLIISIIHIAIPLTVNNIKKDDELKDKLYKSMLYGGITGLSIYGTYNLISIIIYENFSYIIAIIDSIWGFFIFSLLTFTYLNLN
jgi:uncharacterized membrane protein